MRCAKFGVAVSKASMVDWGCQSAMGICALCYICNLLGVMVLQRSMLDLPIRCAKCDVAILKASMVDWGYQSCHGFMCQCAIYETYLV